MDYKKLLEPLVEKFVSELESLEKERLIRLSELEKAIALTEQERENLKVRIIENDKKLIIAKDTVMNERLRQQALNDQIKAETTRYNQLSKECETKIKEIEQNLKNSRAEKEIITETLIRAKAKEKEYNDKVSRLKTDFEKSEAIRKDLAEKQEKLNIQKKVVDDQQGENITTANNLRNERVALEAKAKEVEQWIKRYDFEKFLKEK